MSTTIHYMRDTKKTMPESARLDEDVAAALRKASKDDDRSKSYLINTATRRYLESRGYLKPKK